MSFEENSEDESKEVKPHRLQEAPPDSLRIQAFSTWTSIIRATFNAGVTLLSGRSMAP